MSFMTWNDSYSVGVKTIDQQHAGLFAMVNELHTAMMNGEAKNAVGPLLDKLVKYTLEHFAFEEAHVGDGKVSELRGASCASRRPHSTGEGFHGA